MLMMKKNTGNEGARDDDIGASRDAVPVMRGDKN